MKGTPMHARVFTVTGQLSFPLDMLRYDSCFPASQEDVAELDRAVNPRRNRGSQPCSVRLISYQPSKDWQPTKERWQSFLWGCGEATTA